jgi:alpha-methylacyl-CoA racemase
MLSGVQIVDLSTLLPDPYASMILADLGAKVIT